MQKRLKNGCHTDYACQPLLQGAMSEQTDPQRHDHICPPLAFLLLFFLSFRAWFVTSAAISLVESMRQQQASTGILPDLPAALNFQKRPPAETTRTKSSCSDSKFHSPGNAQILYPRSFDFSTRVHPPGSLFRRAPSSSFLSRLLQPAPVPALTTA